jgi:asparagine synthase (glutamine-hydrolysing)
MSGIAGIYYLDGRPVERTDVERMVDSIAHRGPDGSGVWTEGSVGLGHRMLWTTPESLHEKLPNHFSKWYDTLTHISKLSEQYSR